MSPRSFRNYQRCGKLLRPRLAHLDLVAVQTEEYAENFRVLGVWPERIHVTGSVKFDGVTSDRHNPATQKLRRLLAIADEDPVWIAGSTQAPEEEMVLEIFR